MWQSSGLIIKSCIDNNILFAARCLRCGARKQFSFVLKQHGGWRRFQYAARAAFLRRAANEIELGADK